MNTCTYFFLAAITLTGLTCCENQSLSEPIYYDSATGARIEPATPSTTENPTPTEAPQVAAPSPAGAMAQAPQLAPRQVPVAPQPRQQTKPAADRNLAGPFSTPSVTGLPTKDDLKETETSTSNSNGSSGVRAPKR